MGKVIVRVVRVIGLTLILWFFVGLLFLKTIFGTFQGHESYVIASLGLSLLVCLGVEGRMIANPKEDDWMKIFYPERNGIESEVK